MEGGGATTAGDLVNHGAVCDHDDDAHNQDDDQLMMIIVMMTIMMMTGICGLPILERMLTVGDSRYHPACFTCAQCGAGLEGGQFMEDGDAVICRDCYIRWVVLMIMPPTLLINVLYLFRLKAPWCVRCEKVIISEPGMSHMSLTRNQHCISA